MTNHAYSAVKIGDILTFGDYSNLNCWLVVGFTERPSGRIDAKLICFDSNLLDNAKIYSEPLENLCTHSNLHSKKVWCWRHL